MSLQDDGDEPVDDSPAALAVGADTPDHWSETGL